MVGKPISHLLMDGICPGRGGTADLETRPVALLTSPRPPAQRMEEDFIILRDGKYAGLGRVIDVLRHITELKIIQGAACQPS